LPWAWRLLVNKHSLHIKDSKIISTDSSKLSNTKLQEPHHHVTWWQRRVIKPSFPGQRCCVIPGCLGNSRVDNSAPPCCMKYRFPDRPSGARGRPQRTTFTLNRVQFAGSSSKHTSTLLFFFLQYWGLNSEPSPWATPPALFFCDGFFWDRVSRTVWLGWLRTPVLLISASWVAGITDVSQQCLASLYFVKPPELVWCNSHSNTTLQ
jgi:hypothetical protein